MPVFHTKTIESILEPVAQQVIKSLSKSLSANCHLGVSLERKITIKELYIAFFLYSTNFVEYLSSICIHSINKYEDITLCSCDR